MRRPCDRLQSGALAVLCLALQGGGVALLAAGDQPPPATERQDAWESPGTGQPTVYNRASRLIGMKVGNPAGQSLGRIKDVVIDYRAERVSYAVLAVNRGFLGLSQKLLAVPFSALHPSDDGTHLILNADQKNLEMAQGFPAEQWPDPAAPSWGAAPPWKQGTEVSGPGSNELKTRAPRTVPSRESEEESQDLYPPGSLGYPGF